MRSIVIVALVAAAGCYQPTVSDCVVPCSAGDSCAAGQICGTDGLCAAPEVAGHCAAVQDGGGDPPDASGPPPDAPDACAAACSNGTCDGDVCVIDCSAVGACPNDVFCPVGVPCRVVCGPAGCAHHVDCTQSTSCDVQCTGDGSCQDEIRCPVDDPCTVTCGGVDSCAKRVRCHGSCACDVYCTGAGSCSEVSECPGATTSQCRLGNGCTSSAIGCDTCP